MRHPAVLVGVLTLLTGALVFAQPRPATRPPARPGARPAAQNGPRANVDGGAARGDATAASDGGGPASAMDGGTSGVTEAAQVGDASVRAADVEFPLRQVGNGTLIHFPVPEQLARTAVPVFVQIRSTAPIDHVSLFYRGVGARRYTEVRLTAMGQAQRLPSGYGAQIPCDDIFPPRVEYYVQAIDSSGAPNGAAGTEASPLQLAIVERRSFPAPTLPGQPPPRSCGNLTVAATARDAGAVSNEPVRGTADLGEPCATNNDCRRGLRCGTNRSCVFDRAN